MRPEQTVSEMVEEILTRQARALIEHTGQTFESAYEAVSRTVAGRKLVELSNSPYRDERASDWQESLLRERTERLAAYLLKRPAADDHYSWVEDYLAWLEGKEARDEYYLLLEQEVGASKHE